MEIITLMDLHQRMCYLEEDATLPELLEFLGMRYFEGSRQEGNEDRDVYEFIDNNTMAIEVLIKESKVRFHSKLDVYRNSKDDKFWDILFEANLNLLARLMDLFEEKYSESGSLKFEYYAYGQFEAFDIDCSPMGCRLY